MNVTSHAQHKPRLARIAPRMRWLQCTQLAFALTGACAADEDARISLGELRTVVVDHADETEPTVDMSGARSPAESDVKPRRHAGDGEGDEGVPSLTTYSVVIDGPSPNDPTPDQVQADHAADDAESEVQSPTSQIDVYDYDTLEQCRGRLRDLMLVKSRYAFCQWHEVTIISKRCETSTMCVVTGASDVRVTTIGKGKRNRRTMEVQVALDNWRRSAGYEFPADPESITSVIVSCTRSDMTPCTAAGDVVTNKQVGQWQLSPESVATFNITGQSHDDGPYFTNDQVTKHQFAVRVRGLPEAPPPPPVFYVALQNFRCDTASYFYDGYAGACLFQDYTPIMRYQLASTGQAAVAMHIDFAQRNPMSPDMTIPGDHTAGVLGSRWPLHRLWKNGTNYVNAGLTGTIMSSAEYYVENGREKDYQCRWLQRPPGDYDCDEYPFASTFEGGYYPRLQPSSGSAFSVRIVPRGQNRSAGGLLAAFYAREHVISYDPFFVQIE